MVRFDRKDVICKIFSVATVKLLEQNTSCSLQNVLVCVVLLIFDGSNILMRSLNGNDIWKKV